ncbi:MAG: hypothetical protein AB7L36_00725 [Sphingomonadaceae bacterium]
MAGLTPQEASVMELRDRGLTASKISEMLDLAVDRVARIVAMYDGAGDETRHKLAMRHGSAALLSAINRARAEAA